MVLPRLFPLLVAGASLAAQTAAPSGPVKLTLKDAIATSLANNLQVQIAKETRVITQSGVFNAEGAFDWNLASNLSWGKAESTAFRSATAGATPTRTITDTWNRNFSASLSKPFEWGGTLTMNYAPSYAFSSGVVVNGLVDGSGNILGDRAFATAAPYTGNLSATYTQSLLKGFGRDDAGASLMVARLGARAADYTYQASIIALVASTESAYWDLVYGQRNLDARTQALELAQKQLKENRIRVEVGTMAPLDVVNAEAAVAQAEQNIIAAEAQLIIARETLLRTLYPTTGRPAAIETVDAPNLSHIQLKDEDAEKMALARRVELKGARLDLESKTILEKAADHRTRPTLDAFVTYAGSSDNYRAIGPVNGDLLNARNPGYTVGLSFAYPLQGKAAQGNQAAARASRRSSELSTRDLELGILLEVRTTLRNVEAAEKGVKAAEKTRIFRQRDLEAEQKKFENGMSTNFLVLTKMTDLDTARSAEVQAQITYAKNVTALERAVGNLLEARSLKLE